MRLFIGERFELRDFIDAISVHYFNKWMADYKADEVGEYLIARKFNTHQTGKYDVQEQVELGWKPSRGDFLKWRIDRRSS